MVKTKKFNHFLVDRIKTKIPILTSKFSKKKKNDRIAEMHLYDTYNRKLI